MKIDIIELAKKAKLVVTLSSYDSVHSFAALHREALIASGELVPRGQVEVDKLDAERFRKLQDMPITTAQSFFWNYKSRKERAKAIDRARSQP